MKKEKQLEVNEIVEFEINFINEYFRECSYGEKRNLRSCSACVYVSNRFYILQSYNTIIASIDRETDTLYDFLRYVYGYTATSAQHISKFEKDYCAGKWNCAERYTWRNV